MESYVTLVFSTGDNRKASLRIPKANPEISSGAIKTAMNQIIAAGAISSKNGIVNGSVKAVLNRVTTKEYDIAE